MTLFWLAMRGARRNPLRTALTLVSAAAAIAGFGFLRIVTDSMKAGLTAGAKNRLSVFNPKAKGLPVAYGEKLKTGFAGVVGASGRNFWSLTDPQERPIDAISATDDYQDLKPLCTVPADQFQNWLRDPSGIILPQPLAQERGYHLGDRLPLTTGLAALPSFAATVDGIAKPERDFQCAALVHFNFFNEVAGENKDIVLLYYVEANDPALLPTLAQQIDLAFESSPVQTWSFPANVLGDAMLSAYRSLFTGADILSLILLLVIASVVGNTLLLSVSERTTELAVLRVLGFHPSALMKMMLLEALVIYTAAIVLGVVLASGLTMGFVTYAHEHLPSLTPADPFRISSLLSVSLFVFAGLVLLSLVSGHRASRVPITEALRKIG